MKKRKIKIYANDNDICKKTKNELEKKLIDNGFILSNDADLIIAIGGDGSFIRMIKENKYDTTKNYIGINCGTLGFLQNIPSNKIDEFIERLQNDNFILEDISIQETEVIMKNDKKIVYSINEILIREVDLNPINLQVYVDGEFLEDYAGDGLLICTSTGSTAYNLSFGGSMVFHTFHTMQITPVAPLISKSYRNITNSIIIPERTIVKLNPTNGKNNLLINIDGVNLNFNEVEELKVTCKDKKIKCLRLNDYHFIKTVNDKFLR